MVAMEITYPNAMCMRNVESVFLGIVAVEQEVLHRREAARGIQIDKDIMWSVIYRIWNGRYDRNMRTRLMHASSLTLL